MDYSKGHSYFDAHFTMKTQLLSKNHLSKAMDYSDILIQIRRIVRTVNLESKRIEKEHGISIPQFLCLKFLYEQNNFNASHRAIKDHLKLNASTVTGIINRLEKKGYVAKIPSATDQRLTIISITAVGADLINSIPDPLHEQLTVKLKELSQEEIERLLNAFDVIADFLDINGSDAAPIVTGDTPIIGNSDKNAGNVK